MVNIITGEIDSGKTTKILQIYNATRCGDGFITKKIYINGTNAGQEIVRLSTGEGLVFSLKKCFIQEDWNERHSYYDYSFSEKGLKFAEEIIESSIVKGIQPIYIDEIGPLEICYEQGLYNTFVNVLSGEKEIFVSVRYDCLEMFIKKFEIKENFILIIKRPTIPEELFLTKGLNFFL